MSDLLRNIAGTALMVVGATMASVTLGVLIALFAVTPAHLIPRDAAALVFGGMAGGGMAAVAGVVFCSVTLAVAAITLPPAIWLIRRHDLPRPLSDIVGGAAAALICVLIGLTSMDYPSMRDLVTGEGAQILGIVGVIAGCLTGYGRYLSFVRGEAFELETRPAR
ncbi:MAG: hypothetical protein AB7G40_16870 [Hyphomonadaceae bacterium]